MPKKGVMHNPRLWVSAESTTSMPPRLSNQTGDASGTVKALTRRVDVWLHAVNVFGVLVILFVAGGLFAETSRVQAHWRHTEESELVKLEMLTEFESSFGYNGVIHSLKNYVLRGDEQYAERCEEALSEAHAALDRYSAAAEVSLAERASLQALHKLLDEYSASLQRMRGLDLSPDDADALARVDDAPYVTALEHLRGIISAHQAHIAEEIGHDVRRAQVAAVVLGGGGACAVLLAGTSFVRRARRKIENSTNQLSELQDRYSRAVDGSSDGLWDYNPATDSVWYSDRFKALVGLQADEYDQFEPVLDTFVNLLHPDDRDRTLAAVRAHIEDGKEYDVEYRLRMRSGGYRWFRARGDSKRDENGRVLMMSGTITDIHERYLAERRIAALEERTRLFVEHAPAAVAMFDADMRYLLASKAWYEQYGLEGQSILGKSHYEVFPTIPARWKEIHRRALRGEALEDKQDRFTAEDGSEVWVSWVIRPWHTPEGEVGGIIMFTEVINDRVENERALSDARERAEDASKAKSDFLANMSHEIRTPMTAIIGYADLLCSDLVGDEEGSARAVHTIRTNADHLLAVINDILDVSKIEAGRLEVERIEINPARIIDAVVALLTPSAREKGINLSAVYETPMAETIVSDPTRVRQILFNLLSNAIKFTESGGVTLYVSCRSADQALRFRVVDTGIGMTAAQLGAITRFEAFSQADTSTTRRFGGTGLGLRITNALVTLLGGRLVIESTEGVGSVFAAEIATGDLAGVRMIDPEDVAGEINALPSTAERATVTTRPLEGRRVMLVEDGPDNQRLISFVLERAGARVSVCDNGQVAVEAIGQTRADERPHLILMDMQMPVLDGYGATRLLREEGCATPIIALTAHTMEGDRERCLAVGCDDYLGKPINRDELIAVCTRWAWSEAVAEHRPHA